MYEATSQEMICEIFKNFTFNMKYHRIGLINEEERNVKVKLRSLKYIIQ